MISLCLLFSSLYYVFQYVSCVSLSRSLYISLFISFSLSEKSVSLSFFCLSVSLSLSVSFSLSLSLSPSFPVTPHLFSIIFRSPKDTFTNDLSPFHPLCKNPSVFPSVSVFLPLFSHSLPVQVTYSDHTQLLSPRRPIFLINCGIYSRDQTGVCNLSPSKEASDVRLCGVKSCRSSLKLNIFFRFFTALSSNLKKKAQEWQMFE